MSEGKAEIRKAAELAVERVRQAVAQEEEPHPHVFDALDGVYRLEEARRGEFGADYYEIRDGDPNGRIVGGLVYARGLATHGSVLPSTFVDLFPSGELYPSEDLFPGKSWRWKHFETLPAPGRRERWDRDAMYRQHVQQCELVATFESALSFLRDVPRSEEPSGEGS